MTKIADAKGVEAAIFEQCAADAAPDALFLLGAPRTGSTIVYQACVARFGLPYLSNLTNDCYGETPIVGLALQKALPVAIRFENRYGKTEGALQPSEASAVMSHWFGGGHPSQTVSARVLPGREAHFLRTLAAGHALFGKPLAIKNAWNCFRVAYLAAALPRARFLWIRRDIAEAAASDLEARHATKGSAQAWNSATPANWEALQARPPVEQVLENQYEFNRAVGDTLQAKAAGRWTELWYEDFAAAPERALGLVGEAFGLAPVASVALPPAVPTRKRNLQDEEIAALRDYVRVQGERLGPYGRHRGNPPRRAWNS